MPTVLALSMVAVHLAGVSLLIWADRVRGRGWAVRLAGTLFMVGLAAGVFGAVWMLFISD
jgi:hypothetical protein